MGVERAMLMSALGRIVKVGLEVDVEEESEGEEGVMEERKRGHSSMALERVLRRMGRYVSLVYFPESGTGGGGGGV